MAFQEITVQSVRSTHLSSQVFLDGASYGMEFYYTKVIDTSTGSVSTFWYMDLYDSAKAPLVLGIGLSAGVDILYPYRALQVPPGKLFVNPEGNTYIDPTIDTFTNGEAVLWYQPEADVKALGLSGD